jgi:DNA-binding NarL/FixJ family response regulator
MTNGVATAAAREATRASVRQLNEIVKTLAGFELDTAIAVLEAARRRQRDKKPAEVTSVTSNLSPRETQVLLLSADGLALNDIGQRLGITIRTVEVHRENILRKLGLSNIILAIRWGIRAGIIEP